MAPAGILACGGTGVLGAYLVRDGYAEVLPRLAAEPFTTLR